MAKQHDPKTLIQLLAELYVIIDTLQPNSTIRDQIMAAIEGEPLPFGSLLPLSLPIDNPDYAALIERRNQLKQLIEGRPGHPLEAAIGRLDAALEAYGCKKYPGKLVEYPVIIQRDGTTWMASFPDVPEAATCGDSEEEALSEARDALLTAFEFYFEDRRQVPLPSKPKAGQKIVQVPPSMWEKVLLLNAGCDLPCRAPESKDEYDARVEELE